MKKSLTALAVMAAVSVPFAAAQAGDMEAQVYGKLHMSVDYVDNSVDGMSGADVVHISSNSSRLGFKGSADLGGGMKGVWKIESDVAIGEGETGIGGRNTYAGVETMAGTILLGKHDTPVKTISRKVDLFGDKIGDSRNMLHKNSSVDNRPLESLTYTSPSIAGAQVALQTNLSTGAADTALGMISAAVTYKMGKDLYVAGGYQMSSMEYLQDSDATKYASATDTETAIRVGAKYNMGAIGINALFQMTGNEKGVKDAGHMAYGGGVSYKMGKMAVKAQGYMVGENDSDKKNGTLVALGADYKLGDKTTAYGAFAMTINGDSASYSVSHAGHDNARDTSAGVGKDGAMGISVGLVHSF